MARRWMRGVRASTSLTTSRFLGGTTYLVRVAAVNAVATVDGSAVANFTTERRRPSASRGLAASLTGPRDARLT